LQLSQYTVKQSVELQQYSLHKNTLQNLTETLEVDDCLKALYVEKLTPWPLRLLHLRALVSFGLVYANVTRVVFLHGCSGICVVGLWVFCTSQEIGWEDRLLFCILSLVLT